MKKKNKKEKKHKNNKKYVILIIKVITNFILNAHFFSLKIHNVTNYEYYDHRIIRLKYLTLS